MKIRSGFVSNSSSSSFVILHKGDLEEELNKAFAVPENHPLHPMVKGMVKTILKCQEESFETSEDYIAYDEDSGMDPEIIHMMEHGFKCILGSFSSEEFGVEQILCEETLNYTSDTLVIKHDGGY